MFKFKNHKKPNIKVAYDRNYNLYIKKYKNLTQQDVCELISKFQVLQRTLPRERKPATAKRFFRALKYAFSKTSVDCRGKRYCKG